MYVAFVIHIETNPPHKSRFIYFAAEEKSVFKGKKLVSVNSTDCNLGVSFLNTCSDFHM